VRIVTEAFISGAATSGGVWLLVIGLVWVVYSGFVRVLVLGVLGWVAVMYLMYLMYPVTFEMYLAHLQRLW
jgi:hypothetical protein